MCIVYGGGTQRQILHKTAGLSPKPFYQDQTLVVQDQDYFLVLEPPRD